MRITTALKATAVALTFIALSAPSLAQTEPLADQPTRWGTDDPRIDTLEFPGGTVDEFAKALRKAASDRPVNIVYDDRAADLAVPPMSLRDVDVFTALRSACEPESRTVTRFDDGRVFTWTVTRIDGDASSVYTIHPRDVSPPQFRPGYEAHRPQRSTAVHSITELITGSGAMAADDVLSALQAALAMEEGDEVKLAYHEGTGLLFARVTEAQASVIEMTMRRLRDSSRDRQRADQKNQFDRFLEKLGVDTPEEAERAVNLVTETRGQFQVLQATIRELQQALTLEKQQRAKEGVWMQQQIDTLESDLRVARNELAQQRRDDNPGGEGGRG